MENVKSPDDLPVKEDIVTFLDKMVKTIHRRIEDQSKWISDPDYEYKRIHVCNKEVFELMSDENVPVETRAILEAATCVGYFWVNTKIN